MESHERPSEDGWVLGDVWAARRQLGFAHLRSGIPVAACRGGCEQSG